MRCWPLVLALGAFAGCADPVVDLSLGLPSAQQTPASFDLSCVAAVDVYLEGNQDHDEVHRCISVTSPSSFTDLKAKIAGKLDVKMPSSGLAGIRMRGRMGTCEDTIDDYEPIFIGGAPYLTGEDSLTIPLAPTVSCNATHTYAASTLDLTALLATKQCATALIPADQNPYGYSALIHPLMLGPQFDATVADYGTAWNHVSATGKVTLASFTNAAQSRSCVALGVDADPVTYGLTCINPSAPTLCAAPGEIEIPAMDDAIGTASLDPHLLDTYGAPVFGAVFKQSPASTATKAPIAGATVTLDDPSAGVVVYVDPGATKWAATTAASTGPSGAFIIYLKGDATGVTVKSGASQQHYTVASTSDNWATLLAVLP